MSNDTKVLRASLLFVASILLLVLTLAGCGGGHGSDQLYKTVIHQEESRG